MPTNNKIGLTMQAQALLQKRLPQMVDGGSDFADLLNSRILEVLHLAFSPEELESYGIGRAFTKIDS